MTTWHFKSSNRQQHLILRFISLWSYSPSITWSDGAGKGAAEACWQTELAPRRSSAWEHHAGMKKRQTNVHSKMSLFIYNIDDAKGVILLQWDSVFMPEPYTAVQEEWRTTRKYSIRATRITSAIKSMSLVCWNTTFKNRNAYNKCQHYQRECVLPSTIFSIRFEPSYTVDPKHS